MAADKNVQININVKNNASGEFGKLSHDMDGVSSGLKSMEGLPGPLGEAFGKISGTIGSLSDAAQSAGRTGQALFSDISIGSGLAVLGVSALVAGVVELANWLGEATEKSVQWFEQVNTFAKTTGTSIEEASIKATAAAAAGTDIERLGMSVDMITQRLEAERATAKRVAEQVADAQAKIADLEAAHAEQVEDAGYQIGQQEADLAKQRIRAASSYYDQLSDMESNRVRQSQNYYQQLDDLETQHKQQVSDNERQIADIIANYQDQIAQRQEDYDDQQAQRRKNLNEQLADIDQKAAESRESILSQFANANTESGRAARDAELAALDERTKAEKAKLTSKYDDDTAQAQAQRDKANARDKANEEKRLADLQRQIDRENAAYDQQQQRLAVTWSQQTADYVKQMNRFQVAQDQRAADFDESQRRMEESYSRTLAKQEEAYEKQVKAAQTQIQELQASQDETATRTGRGLEQLGIDADKFFNATASEKFDMLTNALVKVNEKQDTLQDSAKSMADSYGENVDYIIEDSDRARKSLVKGYDDQGDAATRAQQKTKDLKAEYDVFGRYGMTTWVGYIDYMTNHSQQDVEKLAKDTHHYITEGMVPDLEKAKDSFHELQMAQDSVAMSAGTKAAATVAAWNNVKIKLAEFDLAGTMDALRKFFEVALGFNALRITLAPMNEHSVFNNGFWVTPVTEHALGGDFGAGDRMLVGEQGPELVQFNRGGRVLTNSETRQALSASSEVHHDHWHLTVNTQAEASSVIQDYATMRNLAMVPTN